MCDRSGFFIYLVNCISNKGQLYLDKFDISKRHLVNVFYFVVPIIPLLKSYCSKKSKNGGSLSYTRETIV